MPTRPDDRTYATALVRAATAAPSLHNAQPWRFRYLRAEHAVEPRADLDRAMPRTDPDHRAHHLGCGAVLFNLPRPRRFRGRTAVDPHGHRGRRRRDP